MAVIITSGLLLFVCTAIWLTFGRAQLSPYRYKDLDFIFLGGFPLLVLWILWAIATFTVIS